MGANPREKGKRGEREVVHVFVDAGVPAERSAPMQASNGYDSVDEDADVRTAIEGIFVEAKRRERLDLPAWLRELEADCPEGREPILAFRQNRQPWRAVVSLEWLAQLLADTNRGASHPHEH